MPATNHFLASNFPCLILLTIIIFFLQLQVIYARTNSHHCTPSTCGSIHNISSPFRLKDDPHNCGHQNYELVCEANTTLTLYLHSHKYLVKSIDYHNYTIHIADASILPNDTCSFPNHSLSLTKHSPYSIKLFNVRHTPAAMNTPITFLSCPNPLNSSRFVRADACRNTSSASISYIKVGYSNLGEMCSQDIVAMTSMRFRNPDSVISLAEIHASLVYGFHLSWFSARCPTCRGDATCWLEGDTCRVITCITSERVISCAEEGLTVSGLVLGILSSLLVVIIGISIAARIVIGLPALLLILVFRHKTRCRNASLESIPGVDED